MVKNVYRDGKQYIYMKKVKSAVAHVWRKVSHSLCQKYVTLIYKKYIGALKNLSGKSPYSIRPVWLFFNKLVSCINIIWSEKYGV